MYITAAQGYVSEDVPDVFLHYSKAASDDAVGHVSLIDKLHRFGSETKCPWCPRVWKRRDGRYNHDPTSYLKHIVQCRARNSDLVDIAPEFPKKGFVKYFPKHPVYEARCRDQQFAQKTLLGLISTQ